MNQKKFKKVPSLVVIVVIVKFDFSPDILKMKALPGFPPRPPFPPSPPFPPFSPSFPYIVNL